MKRKRTGVEWSTKRGSGLARPRSPLWKSLRGREQLVGEDRDERGDRPTDEVEKRTANRL